MQRQPKAFFDDILEAIRKIEKYSKNLSLDKLKKDEMIQDAIIRNLEIIGEAVKNIPVAVKDENPEIEWKKISGLRDILIHTYFGIDLEIIWGIIAEKLPPLKKKVLKLIESG